MSGGVVWTGLDEYIRELASLPRDMATSSASIMRDAAEDTARELRAAYPVRTGHLRDSVRVVDRSRELKAHASVTNTSEYASAFEYGTQARHTAIGATRGRMPAGKVFIPIVLRRRREATRDVGDVLVDKGATLSST